jgi:GntR family transcriptional regulator / MocR family aminotransferase
VARLPETGSPLPRLPRPDSRLSYAGHRGIPELRAAVAGYLARMRGVVVEPDQVVVCCAASTSTRPGW